MFTVNNLMCCAQSKVPVISRSVPAVSGESAVIETPDPAGGLPPFHGRRTQNHKTPVVWSEKRGQDARCSRSSHRVHSNSHSVINTARHALTLFVLFIYNYYNHFNISLM